MALYSPRAFPFGPVRRGACAALVLALSALVACEKKTPEPTASAPYPPSPFLSPSTKATPTPAPTPTRAGSMQQEPMQITWLDPPAFKRVPPSNPMRKASYVVPRAAGDSDTART